MDLVYLCEENIWMYLVTVTSRQVRGQMCHGHWLCTTTARSLKCLFTLCYSCLTFNWAEVILSPIIGVCIFSQALKQSFFLDLLHVECVCLKFTSLPLTKAAHPLHCQILAEQTDSRAVFTLHLRAYVPPKERHANQRKDTEASRYERRHRCGEQPACYTTYIRGTWARWGRS